LFNTRHLGDSSPRYEVCGLRLNSL
jgi:hypothetical protein